VCEPAWRETRKTGYTRKGTTDVIRDLADYRRGMDLTQTLRDELVAHAREEHPGEACGVLVAPMGHGFPMRFIRMINAAADRTRFYEFQPDDLLSLFRDLDVRGEDVVALVHSHTATSAYPSGVDINGAVHMGMYYVIVSTASDPAEVRAYRIEGGVVLEEPITVHESLPPTAEAVDGP
jgi:proteasome lid subunit RPN8/RPN11